MAVRLAGMGNKNYQRVTKLVVCPYSEIRETRWTGKAVCIESALEKPLHWRKPRKIFVCSMGDLFHESVPFEFIDKVFAVMALCPQHTFQVLTKRPERMLEYMNWYGEPDGVNRTDRRSKIDGSGPIENHICGFTCGLLWPFANVHLGVTAENQAMADKRIPLLLQTPAAKRFVSIEPMLGEVRLNQLRRKHKDGVFIDNALTGFKAHSCGGWTANKLDLVICGGETGPGARPMELAWARSLRCDCFRAGVPFFFKNIGGVRKPKDGHLLDGVKHHPEF